MARKKKEDHVRTLTKIGRKSYCVTLPISIVREMQWESKQRVSVKRWGRKIIIEDIIDMDSLNKSEDPLNPVNNN
jgi:hypothetical protein